MLVRRGVAAGDVAAAATDAEVDPLAADLQAVLAARDRVGRIDPNLVEVLADRHASSLDADVLAENELGRAASATVAECPRRGLID
jgi:hypothetical protein